MPGMRGIETILHQLPKVELHCHDEDVPALVDVIRRTARTGSAVAGWAIEAWGAQPAYVVPVVAGACAFLIIAARYRYLEGAELAAAPEHTPTPAPVPATDPAQTPAP